MQWYTIFVWNWQQSLWYRWIKTISSIQHGLACYILINAPMVAWLLNLRIVFACYLLTVHSFVDTITTEISAKSFFLHWLKLTRPYGIARISIKQVMRFSVSKNLNSVLNNLFKIILYYWIFPLRSSIWFLCWYIFLLKLNVPVFSFFPTLILIGLICSSRCRWNYCYSLPDLFFLLRVR